MKKLFYIVLDGLGDLPIKELGDKTPLESASTFWMDKLAQQGSQGLVYPVGKEIAPESDIAVISLLGYDAYRVYTGRGPLECFAEGLTVEDGDLALRVNFATLQESSFKIIDRRVGRDLTTQEASALCREINEKVKLKEASFEFKNTIGHRGVLVIRKEGKLSGWITNTDPAYEREGVFGVAKEKFEPYILEARPMPGYEKDERAVLAAKLVNEFVDKSKSVLKESEVNKRRIKERKLSANVILCRDAGDRLPKFVSIKEKIGLDMGCFVQMPVEKGIALLCGMEVVEVPLPSENLCQDYSLWAELAIKKIESFQGLYIHIKGPDEPAHDGNFLKKKEVIELIDKYFFGPLLSQVNLDNYVFCVTADHSTVSQQKAHTQDPVPILIRANSLEPDRTTAFSEFQASQGKLGKFLGKEIFSKLLPYIFRD